MFSNPKNQMRVLTVIALLALVLAVVPLITPLVSPAPDAGSAVRGGQSNASVFFPNKDKMEVGSGGSVQFDSGSNVYITPGATVQIPSYAVTAIPTSTPVNGQVISPTAVIVNGTPAFWVTPIPTATPNVSGGLYTVCGSTTITGTGTIAHGLATPAYVSAGLAQDATGDAARVSWTNSSATVTIKVWNSALTPAPNQTGAAVDWCVKGTK